ncbi:MAG: glycosyltransferase family 4 protein [Actinomycetota bacterium]|nr:glycosyltransferase family 4 protein [Actinomycetota bacterium]
MKILLCAQFYPPINGGEERHVRNLALGMLSRGHDVDVLSIAGSLVAAGITDDAGVRIFRVRSSAASLPGLHSDPQRPHSPPWVDPRLRRGVHDLMARERYDVVHSHNWISGSVLGPAAQAGVPTIMTLHDYSHVCAIKRYMRRGVECEGPSLRRCGPCATRHYGLGGVPVAALNWHARRLRERLVSEFVAVSTAVAVRNGLVEGNLPYHVIPNFIPESLLERISVLRNSRLPDGPIVYAGDLSKDKGVDVLLEAYRSLASPPPLLLAGRRTDARLDLPPGARVLPELSHPAVLELIRSARCVAVPSVWPDPCPTVVLEAMALGTPVVAASSGGIVDMIEHGRTGYLVAPGDPVDLAAALGDVIADPRRAGRLGLSARAAVVSFTDARVVPLIESLYRRVSLAHPDRHRRILHHHDDENSSQRRWDLPR